MDRQRDSREHLHRGLDQRLVGFDEVVALLGLAPLLGRRPNVLSGGERQRVALARILMEPANLLLLDEPTHHLDLAGKEVLEDALDQYEGAVIVVTHDRSLMARLATRVVEVNGARVTLYATTGALRHLPVPWEQPLLDTSLVRHAWDSVLIDDLPANPVYAPLPSVKAGMRSLVIIPVRLQEQLTF